MSHILKKKVLGINLFIKASSPPPPPLSLLKQDHEIFNFKTFNSTELTLPEKVYHLSQSEPSILKTFTFQHHLYGAKQLGLRQENLRVSAMINHAEDFLNY